MYVTRLSTASKGFPVIWDEWLARFLLALGVVALPISVVFNHALGLSIVIMVPRIGWRRLLDDMRQIEANRWFVLWMVWALLSVAWTAAPWMDGVGDWWKIAQRLIMAMCLPSVLCHLKSQRWVLKLFCTSVVGVIAVTSAVQVFGLHWPMWSKQIAPIELSVFAAFVMAIGLRTCDGRRASMGWWCIVVSMLVFEFYINVERTGMVVMISLGLFEAWRRFGKQGVLIFSMLIPFALAGIWATSPSFAHRMHQSVDNVVGFQTKPHHALGDNSLGLRLTFAKFCLQSIIHHPVIGRGLAAYRHDFEATGGVKIANYFIPKHPENGYLHLLYELGLVGFGLMGFWFYNTFSNLGRHASAARDRMIIFLIIWLVSGLFFTPFYTNRMLTFFAMMVGLWQSERLQTIMTPSSEDRA